MTDEIFTGQHTRRARWNRLYTVRQIRYIIDPMKSSEIALGTPVFSRSEKLENQLSTMPSFVDLVYVADDGNTIDRQHIYDRNYGFKLELIDLEYDAGIGAKRRAITEANEKPFLFIVDSDHKVPPNADILVEQLKRVPSLGGISGILAEDNKLRTGSHNLYDDGEFLTRDIRERVETDTVAGYQLYKFDFIPNATAFRNECLEDYVWDDEYVIERAHLDFFVGHLLNTDWDFATNPHVVFGHDRSGSSSYVSNRESDTKRTNSEQYFREKWGYKGVLNVQDRWLNSYDPNDETTQMLRSVLAYGLRRLPRPIAWQLIKVINSNTQYDL